MLALYLFTLCPTIYSGDSAEIATAGFTFGIPHPPGYPFFCLFSNLWTRLLRFGEVAFRLNLLSAVVAAATVYLLTLLLLRLGVAWRLAAAVGLGLGLGSGLWSQALISEVYAFDVFLLALALFAAVLAGETRTTARTAILLALVSLWIGHRTVNLLYAPAPLILAWPALRENFRSRRSLLILLLAFTLPFLSFLYLPIASSFDPPLDTGDPESWSRFYTLVTAQAYRGFLFAGSAAENLGHILRSIPRQTGIFLLLTPFGALLAWREQRRIFLGLSYLVLANLLFAAGYRVPDVTVFVLPMMVALAGLAGLGADALWRRSGRIGKALVSLAVLGGAAHLGITNFAANDLRGQTLVRDFARDSLGFAGRDALVLSEVDTVTYSLWYAQFVEGRRRDLLVVCKGRVTDYLQEAAIRRRPDLDLPIYRGADQESRYPALIAERNVSRVPVYVTGTLEVYFSPGDAGRLSEIVEEVPAGLMTLLSPRADPPAPARVAERNRSFWEGAWKNVQRARAQHLDTEMAVTLLHYAGMRVLFARYCLWHGLSEEAIRSARAVQELDPGPLVDEVNRAYRRGNAEYYLSDMPEMAAWLVAIAEGLRDGRLPLEEVHRLMGSQSSLAWERLNEEGIRRAERGDFAGALGFFEQVVAQRPSHQSALFNRAKALGFLGRSEESEKAFEELLRRAPDSLSGLVGLAEARRTRDPQAALELYERALGARGPDGLRALAARRIGELRGARKPGP